MTFTLKITMGNAAMLAYGDIADALRQTADKIGRYAEPQQGDSENIRDENGNKVGSWKITR